MSDNVVALGTLAIGSKESLSAAMASGGCSSTGSATGCGSKEKPEDMDLATGRVKDHPAIPKRRIIISRACMCPSRPPATSSAITATANTIVRTKAAPGGVGAADAAEAARKVIVVANEVPQLSVLGIAGPGDSAYDWQKTRETFRLVTAQIPDIKLCLSSNGLALPDHLDELVEMNVDHVTITINMIDPEVGAKIYPWIFHNRQRIYGVEASRILHERQMEALDGLVARGILVKVNSVLIPGINDAHLLEVNREVKRRGAFLHNIMPLISAPEHGTHFGLTGQRGPTAAELLAVQEACAGGANLMKHCRQCRADAVGLLGEDRGQEFTLDLVPEAPVYDGAARETYRDWVGAEREDRRAAAKAAQEATEAACAASSPKLLVAVTTQGGGRINQHFGHATEFQVFEVDATGVRFAFHRRCDNYCVDGGGEEDRLERVIAALDGIDTVLVAKIGDCPREGLAAAGITALDSWAQDYIEPAISTLYRERMAQKQAITA
ncbi:nitrogenase cofactor biosynthesis protein NifB [Rhodobacter capsulatus]|uniref:nitrogenase cofactor biosynthesis protein NifB n=1 Tax=Rhodobacter capsulatus TaxID=1061 RepID=UPI0040283408